MVLVLLGGVATAQQQAAVDPGLERQLRAEIAAVSEDAAKAFDEGNAAREAGRNDEAAVAYRRAIEYAPTVDHLHRRLCGALGQQSLFDDAMKECDAALAIRASGYNKLGLAVVLVQRHGIGDLERAAPLLIEASDELPNDVQIAQAWCVTLLQSDNQYSLPRCADRLLGLEPDGLVGNFAGAIVAGRAGDVETSRARLRKAKAAGLDDKTYNEINDKLDDVEDATSTFPRWLRTSVWVGLWIGVVWVGVLIVLLVAGFALSRAMLRSVQRSMASSANAIGSDSERRLRGAYKAVLLLSGVYFYVSLPVLLALIVAAGGGAIIGFLAMGVIPIKLVLLIGIVVLATAGAILKSLFVRSDAKPPGEPFPLDKHPKLRMLLDDVAATVGTRPVDKAYLTPGSEMAVTERGGVWTSVRGGRSERSLIMGVALFDGMTQLQLRSILAHEYGHFRNEDTAGGGFALSVRRSLFTLIIRLAQSGVAAAWNPVWWFVRGFHRAYLGMSQGASRLQEVLADRWSIRAFGSEAFIGGYKHVVARSVAFDHEVDATIKEVIDKKAPLPNLYTYEPEQRTRDADVSSEIEKEMTREPTAFDSHPSPKQRLAWAMQLAITRAPQPDDDAPVWDLFADREELERAMTYTVREQIQANHGIWIADTAEAEADDAARGLGSGR
jgi:Zn-dependent protease with chaperone function/tetratricopeptide (TPR) repeat protein